MIISDNERKINANYNQRNKDNNLDKQELPGEEWNDVPFEEVREYDNKPNVRKDQVTFPSWNFDHHGITL